MTVTPHEGTRPTESDGDILDVVIVGAGISGLGAAYHLGERDRATRASRPHRWHLGSVPLPGRALGLLDLHPELAMGTLDR